jgi:hypothetical protein
VRTEGKKKKKDERQQVEHTQKQKKIWLNGVGKNQETIAESKPQQSTEKKKRRRRKKKKKRTPLSDNLVETISLLRDAESSTIRTAMQQPRKMKQYKLFCFLFVCVCVCVCVRVGGKKGKRRRMRARKK